MVARAIHFHSAQREMPLIKVNCAAIPETLLESELFGHVRGAFTGAATNKKGKFALADGGTIFLDEIGTMSPALQAKLLRVLQEREFEPLGSERTQKVDVRVIAATNRDLRQMVADGQFQEDLYYRLNVIPIHIPPLRERREDIPVLVEHFIAQARAARRQADRRHRSRACSRRCRRPTGRATCASSRTPSSARSCCRRRRTIGPDVVRLLGVSSAAPAGLPSLTLRQNLDWAERETVRRALDSSGGVKKDAAEADGHQSARAQLLPGEAPRRIAATRLSSTQATADAKSPYVPCNCFTPPVTSAAITRILFGLRAIRPGIRFAFEDLTMKCFRICSCWWRPPSLRPPRRRRRRSR